MAASSLSLERKTPLRRTGFKPSTPKPVKGPKPRRCAHKGCRAEFTPQRPMQKVCGIPCAQAIAEHAKAKQRALAEKAERAETKAKLEKFKTIPQLKAEAQVIFNQFIRLRDELAGHGCICCGKFATAAALAKPGGAYDACHYRSRGSADHLRFDERNVHLGLKDCNTYGHKDYRGGLIARIGREEVEALESDQTVIKWTREHLEGLKVEYRAKIKALQK